MSRARIVVDDRALAAFCRAHHIRSLALFGSVLRDDFAGTSDVDVLVEFEPGRAPSLLQIIEMEEALSPYLGGRKVDLRTREDLSRYFRDEVIMGAEWHYATG